jgi:hypothetical protein
MSKMTQAAETFLEGNVLHEVHTLFYCHTLYTGSLFAHDVCVSDRLWVCSLGGRRIQRLILC